MKRSISLDSFQTGEPIAADIFDSQNRLLLKKNAVLTESFKQRLKANNINEVFIAIEAIKNIKQTSSQKDAPQTQKLLVSRNYYDLYDDLVYEQQKIKIRASYIKPIQTNFSILTKEFVILMLQDIEASLEFYLQIKKSQPEYNYKSHHINTAILAILISHWLKLNVYTINEIAVVAMLHDVGETRVPQKILEKASYLTDEEWEEIKKHPLYGLEILHKTDWINNRELYGVATHHERLNGKGYPNGFVGSRIPIHSRVVAVSSIFNTATTDRVYAKRRDYIQLLLELTERSYGELDVKVTNVLYNGLADFLQRNNKTILLSNGDKGSLQRDKESSELSILGQNGIYNVKDPQCPRILNIS